MTAIRKLCVIIPVHKPSLSPEEASSLLACYRHLQTFDCFLVFPEGLLINDYLAIHPGLLPKPVAPSWLASLKNYNNMKMSVQFYQQFADYEFMMTYELDSYIFSSEIQQHHGFDFDYIGAPIFDGYMDAKPDASFLGALNSGFSIRNIRACLIVLKLLKKYKLRWKLNRFAYSNVTLLRKKISRNQHNILFNDHLKGYFSGKSFNEDMIWSQVVPLIFPFFRVAPPETAAIFSFEVNPAQLLELNNGQLPLGCHAWPKFSSFWGKYIPVS